MPLLLLVPLLLPLIPLPPPQAMVVVMMVATIPIQLQIASRRRPPVSCPLPLPVVASPRSMPLLRRPRCPASPGRCRRSRRCLLGWPTLVPFSLPVVRRSAPPSRLLLLLPSLASAAVSSHIPTGRSGLRCRSWLAWPLWPSLPNGGPSAVVYRRLLSPPSLSSLTRVPPMLAASEHRRCRP